MLPHRGCTRGRTGVTWSWGYAAQWRSACCMMCCCSCRSISTSESQIRLGGRTTAWRFGSEDMIRFSLNTLGPHLARVMMRSHAGWYHELISSPNSNQLRTSRKNSVRRCFRASVYTHHAIVFHQIGASVRGSVLLRLLFRLGHAEHMPSCHHAIMLGTSGLLFGFESIVGWLILGLKELGRGYG